MKLLARLCGELRLHGELRGELCGELHGELCGELSSHGAPWLGRASRQGYVILRFLKGLLTGLCGWVCLVRGPVSCKAAGRAPLWDTGY